MSDGPSRVGDSKNDEDEESLLDLWSTERHGKRARLADSDEPSTLQLGPAFNSEAKAWPKILKVGPQSFVSLYSPLQKI